nr:homeobox-leucine zipper protein ROC8 [Tanacetum cinerariifolium]
MQVTSAMVPNKKFTVLRTCLQIDQGTWVIAEPSHVDAPNTYRRLPSGCLIERITKKLSKVTLVEHMEVAEPLPNRSGFAFAAERMNVGPNEDCNSTLWRSVTGSEDMKVYDSLYKSSANFEVAGGVVTFGVRHSPELVLETLGDEETYHEVHIDGSPKDTMLISRFSITTNGVTAATNTGGFVITLVLRKLVEGNQPLQEKMQQSIESITFAINHTVERVKEALEKHQDLLREECAYATCIEIGQLRSSSCKTSYECLN